MIYNICGSPVYNPLAYSKTYAPMFEKMSNININQITYIYLIYLEYGKIYIGKTTNIQRRLREHYNGIGSMVTKKFRPINHKIIDKCPGYYSDKLEQQYTDEFISKYGYDNVRGGKYVNSHTLN